MAVLGAGIAILLFRTGTTEVAAIQTKRISSNIALEMGRVDATISIPPAVIDQISAQARVDSPIECCGLLIGNLVASGFEVTRSIATRNIASGDRRRTYQIDWCPLLSAARLSRTTPDVLLGFFHSHPDGSSAPSRMDRASAWVGVAYLIIPMNQTWVGKPAAWWVPDEGAAFERLGLL